MDGDQDEGTKAVGAMLKDLGLSSAHDDDDPDAITIVKEDGTMEKIYLVYEDPAEKMPPPSPSPPTPAASPAPPLTAQGAKRLAEEILREVVLEAVKTVEKRKQEKQEADKREKGRSRCEAKNALFLHVLETLLEFRRKNITNVQEML